MKLMIEIPDNKVPFIMELLSKYKFINFKPEIPKKMEKDFEQEWKSFSKSLYQGSMDITNDEIDAEIKAVRQEKRQMSNLSSQQ